MHTFRADNNIAFIHHGGYDGDVKIVKHRKDGTYEELEIPMDSLIQFVASYVQLKKISKLEKATDKQILGID